MQAAPTSGEGCLNSLLSAPKTVFSPRHDHTSIILTSFSFSYGDSTTAPHTSTYASSSSPRVASTNHATSIEINPQNAALENACAVLPTAVGHHNERITTALTSISPRAAQTWKEAWAGR